MIDEIVPDRNAVMPTIELIERSIWRIRITMLWPIVNSAMMETFSSMSLMLCPLRNLGLSTVVIIVRAASKISKLISRLCNSTRNHCAPDVSVVFVVMISMLSVRLRRT
jgi:hypothetical protein